MSLRTLTLGALALSVGCTGSIGGDPPEGSPGPGTGTQTSAFSCDPSLIAPEIPLRRLSRTQYRNSIRDLVARTAGDESETIFAELEDVIATMPDDLKKGPDVHYALLHRLDQAVYQETVEAAYEVGAAFGDAFASSDARLTKLAGACAIDADTGNDAACVDAFLRGFGERVLRRPLTDDDVAFYRAVIDGPVERADYVDMVTMLMSAPHFLYFVEHGNDDSEEGEGEPAPLSAFEMASRLSYHFWQTMPDDELLAVAKDGSLLDEEVFAEQVARLFADARTEGALEEFFADWLDPYHLGDLDAKVGTAPYDAFRGDFTPTAELRGNMMSELVGMASYFSRSPDGTFDDLFLSNQSFAKTDDVAALYGVPVWEGGEPPTFPDAARQGLITRAALTASGLATTRPVMKGVYIRKALLCQEIPPPPGDATAVAAELEGQVFTAREKAQAITELRDDCAGCHATLINPLGFVTEAFDGLGRFRSEEQIFDQTTGELLATRPVDATAAPYVLGEDLRVATSPADLNSFLIESEKPQACFARQYFRFTFGREESDKEDGCTLASLHQAVLEGDSLASVLKSIALRPEFRRRSFDQ